MRFTREYIGRCTRDLPDGLMDVLFQIDTQLRRDGNPAEYWPPKCGCGSTFVVYPGSIDHIVTLEAVL